MSTKKIAWVCIKLCQAANVITDNEQTATNETRMPKILLLLLITLGALAAFIGYCAALLDWIQDYTGGVYGQNYMEAVLETSALAVYTYLGIRFFNRNVGLLR